MCKCRFFIFTFMMKQEVQGLQVLSFSLVTVNDEHTKPRFQRKRMG